MVLSTVLGNSQRKYLEPLCFLNFFFYKLIITTVGNEEFLLDS